MISASKSTLSLNNLKILRPKVTKNLTKFPKKFYESQPRGSQLKIYAGQIFFKVIMGAKIDVFVCKTCSNTQLNLCYSIPSRVVGPNVIPQWATFGPRAVYYGCLQV